MNAESVQSTLELLGLDSMTGLTQVYFGNTGLAWMSAAIFLVAIWAALAVLRHVVIARLKAISAKTSMKMDDVVIDFLESIGVWFYLAVALYASVQSLALPSVIELGIRGLFLLVLVGEAIKLAEKIVSYILAAKLAASGAEETSSMKSAVTLIIRVILWTVGLLLILSNLGFNVTSLIASLGIGGLAISLALQPVLTDIFSSFSIVLDKPFQEGDFIVAGDYMGTVKHIGLKTTRLTALQGEELVISNTELTSARIQNFKRMKERRIVFSVGVTYDTPKVKLENIPKLIAAIIDAHPKTNFDRANFATFADSSLNFEIVYAVTSGNYNEYMATQEDINLGIVEAFEKEKIEMAFPTRTVHMINS